jgi:diaminohydroxyphosphoribosylaminopyrimidine deaminase/5-amino-6-(5-phosphoribosylamino)uracil reductase
LGINWTWFSIIMKPTSQASDTIYITQALKLAKKGTGYTNPNPMVGAVIVSGDSVVGSGYHHQAGKAHAEIEALRSMKGPASGATLYVNLEPCSHQGRTPSCVEAIIAAGVSRVVCSTLDPNPLVSGSGVARLRQEGLEVSVGALSQEARTLNEAFFGFHEKHRPFIAIKFAASLDGKIATASHDSKWITNEKARQYARNLRSQYQATMVGVNTVIHDDPHLGARQPGKPDALRIILDSSLRIPLKSQVLRDGNVLIVTTRRAAEAKAKALTDRGIPLFISKGDTISLPEVMKELYRREIISVLVEGGGAVLGSFVDSRLVDKVYAFYGPLIIGGAESVAAIAGHGAATISQSLQLTDLAHKKLNDTFLISGYTSQLSNG